MGRRILNEALSAIVNAERRGFATTRLQPISNVISSFLNIMKHRGYIKDFHVHDPHRVGKITVELHGRVNNCRVLTYRQDLKAQDIENYRLRALPTRQVISLFVLGVASLSSSSQAIQYLWGYVVDFNSEWGFGS